MLFLKDLYKQQNLHHLLSMTDLSLIGAGFYSNFIFIFLDISERFEVALRIISMFDFKILKFYDISGFFHMNCLFF